MCRFATIQNVTDDDRRHAVPKARPTKYGRPKTLFFDFGIVAMATKFGLFLQKIQIASFLFLDGIEPFLGRQFTMTPSTNIVLRFLI